MSDSDSDASIDQLAEFQKANVRPGMFVSGWEDPNDEVYETKNPRGEYFAHQFANSHSILTVSLFCVEQKRCKRKFSGQRTKARPI